MRTEQLQYRSNQFFGDVRLGDSAQWVLVFGSRELICDRKIFNSIRRMYPKAYLMGCSTSGEIYDSYANENSISITAIQFEKANVKFKSYAISSSESFDVGQKIISELEKTDLKHVFVLCDGLNINGSKLVEGMRSIINNEIPITGGLAGDGASFSKTYIVDNDYAKSDHIVLAALYGQIKTGCASVGGWDTFGIDRIVTKSQDNILYEMDGKQALDLYKEYLGDKANELPSSALLFPLSVRPKDSDQYLVRTILSVNEEEKSLVFAGDIPMNSYCKLMKSNYNNLVSGSMKAAEIGKDMLDADKAELAILVSCVGRKLVLKQRADEEIEVVREVVGKDTAITGFYSYGEIAPYKSDTMCELHNQTMTVTFLTEE